MYKPGDPVKLLIAGSRSLANHAIYPAIESALCNPNFTIAEIVHGDAPGVDRTAALWAERNGFPVTAFPAHWQNPDSPSFHFSKGYDPLAGFRRNEEMADYADRALIIWDGESKGTQHMMAAMRSRGKLADVVKIPLSQKTARLPKALFAQLQNARRNADALRQSDPHYSNPRHNDPQKSRFVKNLVKRKEKLYLPQNQ